MKVLSSRWWLLAVLGLIMPVSVATAQDGKKVIIIKKDDGGSTTPTITKKTTITKTTPKSTTSPVNPPKDPNTLKPSTVSGSRGEAGGIVVLYPRISPRTEDAEIHRVAAALQTRMQTLANGLAPDATKVDVRPKPERVCPQGGCLAASIGIVLAQSDGACVALAVVSPPGRTAQTLIPWVGKVQLKSSTVPFREAPEGEFTITDFARCSDVTGKMEDNMADIESALRSALR